MRATNTQKTLSKAPAPQPVRARKHTPMSQKEITDLLLALRPNSQILIVFGSPTKQEEKLAFVKSTEKDGTELQRVNLTSGASSLTIDEDTGWTLDFAHHVVCIEDATASR